MKDYYNFFLLYLLQLKVLHLQLKKEPGHLGQVYFNYFGFKSLYAANNFTKFLSPSRIPIEIYKEGRSIVNITDQSKEAYLFYDCF